MTSFILIAREQGEYVFASCLEKQNAVLQLFAHTHSAEERYHIIIALGKKQKPLEERREEWRIKGCQSATYITTKYDEGRCYFDIYSEALISAGLGQLLTMVYSGETVETVLSCPSSYLTTLALSSLLSPSRSQGLESMLFRMKYEALRMQGAL